MEEEVFENERYQPFKGWGHNWPGHFLPTDKVGHWSHRDGTPGKSSSMAFSAVAPKLPKASLQLHYHAKIRAVACPGTACFPGIIMCQLAFSGKAWTPHKAIEGALR